MNSDPGVPKDVEDSVKWRLLDETVSQVRKAFADVPNCELNATIDEAIAKVRTDRGRSQFEAGVKSLETIGPFARGPSFGT
jgi:hypothetical protein